MKKICETLIMDISNPYVWDEFNFEPDKFYSSVFLELILNYDMEDVRFLPNLASKFFTGFIIISIIFFSFNFL